MTKLSPTMQGTMWQLAGVDARMLPLPMRVSWRKDWRTHEALLRRGLVANPEWGVWALTATGKTWIDTEMNRARFEAKKINQSCPWCRCPNASALHISNCHDAPVNATAAPKCSVCRFDPPLPDSTMCGACTAEENEADAIMREQNYSYEH